ncbi:SMI1/KNR4 family protein [Aureivirga sp. CE67]|uniref:SMI1/KNR4 family protein n=1 Tax=Aureivirga sp. CE67 TaxID=1788983 RepID=UPI0018CA47EF|nr:SMI1/KNR4 family protein [Aureivirga sp. CE67]
MNLIDFKRNLEKIKNGNESFVFSLSEGADDLIFKEVEERLKLTIPDKTKEFYRFHNGFKTLQPDFELFSIENWILLENKEIHFATFDNKIKVYLKSSIINSANQWTIITHDPEYKITLTMGSFWSNKIWKWLRYERAIWCDEFKKE